MSQSPALDFKKRVIVQRLKEEQRLKEDNARLKEKHARELLARRYLRELLAAGKTVARQATAQWLPTIMLCDRVLAKPTFIQRMKGEAPYQSELITEGWFILPGFPTFYDREAPGHYRYGTNGLALGKDGSLYLHSMRNEAPMIHVQTEALNKDWEYTRIRGRFDYPDPVQSFILEISKLADSLAKFSLKIN